MGKDLEKVFSDSAVAVLQKRYVLKDTEGKPIEDIDGLFHRVSDAIAKAELKYDLNADGSPSDVAMKKYDHYRDEFYQMMIDRNFMPNSPTLMNAGKPDGQLSACFVLPIEDSMEGIFDAIKNAALIHKSGGGTGFSFSRLRPEGSTVRSTGGIASGPISFMKAFDAATEAVKQGGCLIGSTYVLTENGPVQIKDLRHGMKVLTACGYYPCTDPWMTKQGAEVWLLSTLDFNENSFSIVATPDHPILTGITEEGYVYTKLQDLKVGDTVINKCDASGDTDYVTVVSIVRQYAVEDVWNVEVPDVHNYYVCNSMDTVGMFVSNTRRGANMGMLRVDHPDIKKFITVKNDLKTLNNFNISVAITDAFMRAVKNHTTYDIVDPHTGKVVDQYDANEIFDMIIDSAWRTGEPGIFFIDRTNDHNTLKEIYGNIEATNPCGEQPLLPYEACNLGSINLANMVAKKRDGIELDPTYMEFSAFMIDPGAAMNCIDYDKLKATVRSAVRFLDNVITVNCYPLPEIEEMCLNTRKIGLGVMGFADVCYMLGIRYGSDASINLARRIMKFINDIAIDESEHLAIERGCYPDLIKLGKYNVRPHVSPRRNNTVTTIAPTGTIGIIADASSGIEPIFSLAYYRNAMDDNKFIYINKHVEAFLKSHFAEESVEYLMDLIVKNHGSTKGLADMDDFSIKKVHLLDDRYSLTNSNVEDLTNRVLVYLEKIFVSAHDILPEEHIMIQAAFQEYVENAISKTINFTGDATHEDVRKAYILAYEKNCKGVTVYRDGCRDTQVLNNISSGTPKKEEFTEQKSIYPESFYDLPTDLKEKYLYEIMTGTVVGEILCDGCTKGKYPGLGPDQKAAEQLATAELVSIVPRDRPDEVTGFTKKIQIGCGKLYVTVNHDENGICEVFTNNGKSGGCPSQSEATARLVSIALRAGVDIDEIVRQLRGIRCPSCQRNPNVKVLSCPDAIGRMIEEATRRLKESEAEVPTYNYFKYSDYLSDEIKKYDEGQCSSADCPPVCTNDAVTTKEPELLPGTITVKDCKPEVHRLGVCPECGADLAHESGCLSCYECGWSKCN